jgi:hypothetical protein
MIRMLNRQWQKESMELLLLKVILLTVSGTKSLNTYLDMVQIH